MIFNLVDSSDVFYIYIFSVSYSAVSIVVDTLEGVFSKNVLSDF